MSFTHLWLGELDGVPSVTALHIPSAALSVLGSWLDAWVALPCCSLVVMVEEGLSGHPFPSAAT